MIVMGRMILRTVRMMMPREVFTGERALIMITKVMTMVIVLIVNIMITIIMI